VFSVKQILNIAHYEMVHILKDPILFLMVFFIPFLYAALFGSIYMAGLLQHVPLAIVDLDHSHYSEDIVEAFANTPHFQVIDSVKTYAGLEEAMSNGAVRAGVVIPEDYAKKLSQHQLAQILVVYDGSNLIYGFNTRKYFNEILNTVSAGHTSSYLAGLGMTKREIINVLDTVSCNMEVWYNPTFNYGTYIFMGYVIMILHQIGLLSISLTVTREKERNSWLQYLCSPLSQWKIFTGKALPYFLVNFFNYGLLLWLALHLVNVKFGGSLAQVVLLGLLFDLIIIGLGFCISVHAPNSLQVTRYLMLMSVPMFILSGFTWPQLYIPTGLNILARFLPFTWMAEAFRLTTVKELGFGSLSLTFLVMLLMAAITIFFAVTFTKRKTLPRKVSLAVNGENTYPRK
jgi:ABC-2 type transport system permease protein